MYEELLRIHREAVQPDAGPEVSLPEPVARQCVRAAPVRHPAARGLRRRHRRHRHGQDDAVPGAARAIDQTTFTALVLNPFLSEEDLLSGSCRISASSLAPSSKRGAWPASSKQELIDTLYDFLLGLIPLKASAVLDHRRSAEPAAARARADSDSVESRDRQGKAPADHPGRTVEPARPAQIARAPSARSARVHPLPS